MDNSKNKQSTMKGPGHGVGRVVEKPKDFKGTLKKLLVYMGQYKVRIILVALFAILSTVFTIVTPKILGNVTDEVVSDFIDIKIYDEAQKNLPEGVLIPEGATGEDILKMLPAQMKDQIPDELVEKIMDLDLSERPTIDLEEILDSVYLLIGLYVLSAIFSYIQGWVMTAISQKVTYQMRKDISQKIHTLPLKYFDTRTHGEILSRITNDIDTVGQTLNQSLTQIVTSVSTIIGILIMMISINLVMTGITLLILPISALFVMFIVKRSQPLFKGQQKTLGELNGHIEEIFSGHYVVKAFNGEEKAIEEFKKLNNELYDVGWRSQFLSGMMMPVMRFIGNVGYVAISVAGGYFAISGNVSVGDIQAFIQYLNSFTHPIVNTATMANVLQSTVAAAERVFEFLEEKDQLTEAEDPILLGNVRGDIEFDNIVFAYNKDEPVINGFSADIKAGQQIAIVGPTGAGKTTLVNLLMRFYEVGEGAIRIDGVDIRELRRADLRRMFGMVLQDTWLFSGTIRENLVYGNPDATNREVKYACKAAHVHSFVNSLPKGYRMEINEETDNISQGEKQLLTIARAMIADPPMLILDEATSSVDTRTEFAIQKAMDNLMQGRTSFVIAHRLSTIRNADLILVLKEGNIVEQGTHQELLDKKGFYHELYNSQFNGEIAS